MVKLLKGIVPPTAPVSVTVPPVPPFKETGCAPSTVLEKERFAPAAAAPPLVVSTLKEAPTDTGPVIVTIPPLVVIFPTKLMTVDPV